MKKNFFAIALTMGSCFSICNICDASQPETALEKADLSNSTEAIKLINVSNLFKEMTDEKALQLAKDLQKLLVNNKTEIAQIAKRREERSIKSSIISCSKEKDLLHADYELMPGSKTWMPQILSMDNWLTSGLGMLNKYEFSLNNVMEFPSGNHAKLNIQGILEALMRHYDDPFWIKAHAFSRLVQSRKLEVPGNLYAPHNTWFSEADDAFALEKIQKDMLKLILERIGDTENAKKVETIFNNYEQYLPEAEKFVKVLEKKVNEAPAKNSH